MIFTRRWLLRNN